MLVQYTVENYKSIRDEVVISFRADERYQDSEWVTQDETISPPLYKCIGLMGPNESGKTNIIESFRFAFRFILNTIKRRDSSKIDVEKFAFDEKMDKKPTSFEFVFYRNAVKYVYGFSVSRYEVLEEYLTGEYLTGHSAGELEMFFERYDGQQYEFWDTDAEVQQEIAKKTNPNRLYMPVAAEWGYAPLKEVYQWFEFYARQYDRFSVVEMVGKIIKNENRKKIFIHELQKADFNIKDVYIKKIRMDQKSKDTLKRLLDAVNAMDAVNEEFVIADAIPDIRIIHQNYLGKTYEVMLEEDSAGTESFIENVSEFLSISEQGGVMVNDELGKDYHARLMQHFLKMFRSNTANPGDAQLFFTTHNTKILNMLNPDQIYLVDKEESGATYVKLLDDYAICEDEDIELGYLKGRYGGVPYMKG